MKMLLYEQQLEQLKEVISMEDINNKVDYLYNRMFEKYYGDDELLAWQKINFFGGGNIDKYKSKIKELIINGKRVKTGYQTSKKLRGAKTYYIFYK